LRNDQILVVLSCQDNILCDSKTINNPGIKYIFEHTKLLGDPKKITTVEDNIIQYLMKSDKESKEQIYDSYDSKVICILNTSYIYKRIYQKDVPRLQNRKYDIVFTGATNYDGIYGEHRKEIIKRIEEFAKKYRCTYFVNHGKLELNKYYELLKQTKIFISPYGYGEFSLHP